MVQFFRQTQAMEVMGACEHVSIILFFLKAKSPLGNKQNMKIWS
jgi:hypothetical protein